MNLLFWLFVLVLVVLAVFAFFFHARFVALLQRFEAVLASLEKIGAPKAAASEPAAAPGPSFTGSAE